MTGDVVEKARLLWRGTACLSCLKMLSERENLGEGMYYCSLVGIEGLKVVWRDNIYFYL
jgi:hypothetical protein